MRRVHSNGKVEKEHIPRFRRILGGLVVVLCFMGIAVLWLSSVNSEARSKQQIQQLLTRRADALSQKDLSQYLVCFSQQYHSGQHRYADLRENAARWFAEFATIRFSFHIVDIQMQQRDVALVENAYTFSLTGDDGTSLDIAKRELLEIHHEETGWKITRAHTLE